MRMYDIIMKKRNGEVLSTEEINFFIKGYTEGKIPDYQASALTMAIYFQGMTPKETAALTMAMAKSGDVLDLSPIKGIKVDKHSTGGVGDKTSLVLAPMVAALGIPVAKMSGRGLGHTGGTIDKLESFDGFETGISEEEFFDNVNRIGIAIAGQTGNLAPADKKLYALRDVTATVESIPLIASSIMSKKIAAGADVIVLDVKTGSGAFMKTPKDSLLLAREMVEIGTNVGRKTMAVVSNMDEPLGYAVGNSLEVIEAINTLNGKGPKDLLDLCITLGSYMVVGAGKAENVEEAGKMLKEVIDNKAALHKLAEMVKAQKGDERAVYDTSLLPKANLCKEFIADRDGYVERIICDTVGLSAMVLGGGRETKESTIDLSVGIMLHKKTGDYVKKGESVATFYANDESKLSDGMERFSKAYIFTDKPVAKQKLIRYIVTDSKVTENE
ncbi:MAG: pyrimidine-nucleoside phosphorylase [Butyrivibrio sp.]